MIPDTDTNLTINAAMFQMATLSPKVKESVELELYRTSADSDGSTEQVVLEDAFVNLIKDIESIGITINYDYGDIVEETEKLLDFLKLINYLLPNGLYDILKSNSRIRECVEHLLDGSLGDNQTLLQTYLSDLGGLDGQPALAPDLMEIVDQFYPVMEQTDIFTDYLRNVSSLVAQERLSVESDHKSHDQYRAVIRDFIGRLSDAVNLLDQHPLYGTLCKIQNQIIKDFTASVNFVDYNYLFTQSIDALPDDLHWLFNRRQYHYRVSHKWCAEYYQIRSIPADPAYALMIYCFMYAITPLEEDFNSRVAAFQAIHPVVDIDKMIATLYQYLD